MVEIGEVFERGEKRVRWPLVGGGRSVVRYVNAIEIAAEKWCT